jgi:hypothetical protein
MKEVNLTAIHLLNQTQVICVVSGVMYTSLLVNCNLLLQIDGVMRKKKIEGVEKLVGMSDKNETYTEIGILIYLEKGTDYNNIRSLREDNIGATIIDLQE